jgi:hypothetical protein
MPFKYPNELPSAVSPLDAIQVSRVYRDTRNDLYVRPCGRIGEMYEIHTEPLTCAGTPFGELGGFRLNYWIHCTRLQGGLVPFQEDQIKQLCQRFTDCRLTQGRII